MVDLGQARPLPVVVVVAATIVDADEAIERVTDAYVVGLEARVVDVANVDPVSRELLGLALLVAVAVVVALVKKPVALMKRVRVDIAQKS